jgi:hypothetical protein
VVPDEAPTRLGNTGRIVMRMLAIVMILLSACGMAHAAEIDALISTAIKAADGRAAAALRARERSHHPRELWSLRRTHPPL